MRIVITILTAFAFMLAACGPTVKNAKTETFKVFGNCEMCKKTIETAANKGDEAKVTWDKDTKIATIVFDTTKTKADDVLKRIALAGYDNEKYLAPDDAYSKLHECCQYERAPKDYAPMVNTPAPGM